MRSMFSRVAAVTIAVILSLSATGAAALANGGPAGSAVRMATGSSEAINLSVGDIRRCLSLTKTLNVYYLVDDSGSLRGPKGSESDPDVKRAGILSDSLTQLSELQGEGIEVNWAMGYFTDSYEAAVEWDGLDGDSAGRMATEIERKNQEEGQGWTNWLEGIKGAQQSLAAQQTSSPGCAVLVWLTDGALDIRTNPSGNTPDIAAQEAAFAELCGNPLGTSDPNARGVFNELRQANVAVFGVMLNTSTPGGPVAEHLQKLDGAMVPLVEGEGQIAGQSQSCGQNPIPEGYAHGAYLEGTSQSLGLVFAGLGAQLAGGYPNPISDTGLFPIVEGVSQFRLTIPGSDFTLTPPSGSGLPEISRATQADGVELASSGDATVVTVDTTDPERWGDWQLTSDRKDVSLFLFSGLSIGFDPATLTAGESGDVIGTIRNANGDAADLSLYRLSESAARILPDGSEAPVDLDVDADGTFTVSVPASTDVSTVVRLRVTLDRLTTAVADLALAPVQAESDIDTTIPGHFPQLSETRPLTDLEGQDGAAEGALVFMGPADGGWGEVCLGEDAVEVTSDSADRAGTWQWPEPRPGCHRVETGSQIEIPLRATNSVAAESSVTAVVTVELRSSDGESIAQDVPVQFRSTHPVNEAAVLGLALALLALGILIPLLLLWLLNWWTTRLDIDSSIQRASFQARVGAKGLTFVDAPDSDVRLSERFSYRGVARNVRRIEDPDLGVMKARVPWFPLRAPWYAVAPTGGRAVIAARTSRSAASAGERLDDGSMRFLQLPFDSFWAATIDRTKLTARDDAAGTPATVVVYHRFDPSSQTQYRDRLQDIAGDPAIASTLEKLRAAVQAEQLANASKPKRPATPSARSRGGAEPNPSAPGRQGPQPPASGAVPPPRSGAVPPPRSNGPAQGPAAPSGPAGRPNGPASPPEGSPSSGSSTTPPPPPPRGR